MRACPRARHGNGRGRQRALPLFTFGTSGAEMNRPLLCRVEGSQNSLLRIWAVRAVVLSNAGLLWSATLPIAYTAVRDPVTLLIVLLSIAVLLTRKVDSLWVILVTALIQLSAAAMNLVSGL